MSYIEYVVLAACTFENLIGVAVCEMCGTACPSDSTSTPVEMQVTWFCRHCTLINSGIAPRCSACEQPRDDIDMPVSPPGEETERHSDSDSDSDGDSEAHEGIPIVKTTFSSHNERPGVIMVTLKGTYTDEQRFEIRLSKAMSTGGMVPARLSERMRLWTPHYDNVLLEFLNTQSNVDELNTYKVSLPKQTRMLYQATSFHDFSAMDVYARAQLFCTFNDNIKDLLPHLNLLNPDSRSIGAMIRRNNRYVFLNVKQPLLDSAIEETTLSSGSGLPGVLLLNNFKAIESSEEGRIEPSKSTNCFVQAFQQLQKKNDVSVYKHIFSGDRVFQITFEGESGIDAGGVFREGMSRILEDLFSDTFNLLLLCPNGKHNVYLNTEKFVPNPLHSGMLEIHMFEFIGRLMGTSLRVKLCLPFEFPSVIWKLLVGDDLIEEDFRSFDSISYSQIKEIMECDSHGAIDIESFNEKFDGKYVFSCIGTDGMEHEVCPDGKDIAVTFENRLDYCNKVIAYRLHEFDAQASAIKRGLEEVVPLHLLQLFSWQQLEVLVAGTPIFDMRLWKSKTDYEGVSSKTRELFWKVMESLSPKEHSGFVRFAWGRSRLPSEKQFTTRMRLTDGGGQSLPVSHTCFFSIEIPAYETEAEMRRGLLTAIHFGQGGILNG
jgi:hypothetical protein